MEPGRTCGDIKARTEAKILDIESRIAVVAVNEQRIIKVSENLYKELRKLSPKVTSGLVRMRSETFKDGAVPAKYKILAALSIVVVTKCEPCIKAYTLMAYKAGVALDELIEFLNVAIVGSGCPGEQWSLKALKIYKDIQQGRYNGEDICCDEAMVSHR